MKRIIALVVLVFVVSAASAQNEFRKGVALLNLGAGIGNEVYPSGDGWKSDLSPIAISAEWGLVDNLFGSPKTTLGLGGYLGTASAKLPVVAGYGIESTATIIGLRSNVHYQFNVKGLDTYAGVMLGYNAASAKWYGQGYVGDPATQDGFSFSIHLGAGYYFNNWFGLYGELGYGISYLTLGLSFRL